MKTEKIFDIIFWSIIVILIIGFIALCFHVGIFIAICLYFVGFLALMILITEVM